MNNQKIIHNRIRCKKCGDIIESFSEHDFKFCSCQACAVDGGHDYLRRLGWEDDWEEMSEVEKTNTFDPYEEYIGSLIDDFVNKEK